MSAAKLRHTQKYAHTRKAHTHTQKGYKSNKNIHLHNYGQRNEKKAPQKEREEDVEYVSEEIQMKRQSFAYAVDVCVCLRGSL